MDADQLLKKGELSASLEALKSQIRSEPANPALRVFLFQLYSVLGQWKNSLLQLEVLAGMDKSNIGMKCLYSTAINCQLLRDEIFAGSKTPVIMGEPSAWVGLLVRAMNAEADIACRLREKAYTDAEESKGSINGESFSWIIDGDSRIGPLLEVIVDGKYYWIEFTKISKLTIKEVSDLRDMVWVRAELWLNSGSQVPALIPVRYPETASLDDSDFLLSRKTDWISLGNETYRGIGQKMFFTDNGEYSLLDVREITIG